MIAAIAWTVGGLLTVFLLRRLAFLMASGLRPRPTRLDGTRSIAIIVAARDEAVRLPTLLAALDRMDYPRDKRHIVLVSDGSTDRTAAIMHAWAGTHGDVRVLAPDRSAGKGAALAAGLAAAPPSDLVAVFDADCEPEPDVLRILSGAFDDPTVGAAAGYPRPANADRTIVSRYAAIERWAHHLVNLAGKDRLGLDPPISGVAFAVRRTALDQAGGFPTDRSAEDLELSTALVAKGWRLRWLAGAVVREDVPTTRAEWAAQRARWSRGVLQSAPRARSVEGLLVAGGYLDRVALVMAMALVGVGRMSIWIPVAYLLAPGLTLLAAVQRSKERPILPYLVATLVMFPADLLMSVRSVAGLGRPAASSWRRGA